MLREREKEIAEKKVIALKEKITSELTEYGLWITSQQVYSELSGIKTETKKRNALKAQLRFRKTVLKQTADESLYKFSSKEKGQFSSQVLCQHLLKLISDAECHSDHEAISSTEDTDLTGKCILHNFENSDGVIKPYKGRVISQVPGFSEWYNVVYDEEAGIVYTFKLEEDIQNGDLKIIINNYILLNKCYKHT